jgi:cytoplasmic iron level regulating protein YaaA (DUF328/UPF0246 family)
VEEIVLKIAIITSCSKEKGSAEAIARNLYTGQFFQAINKLALRYNAELYILSAKYGLISAQKRIKPYDQRIETREDIKRLKTTLEPLMQQILAANDIVLLLMGRDYQSVFEAYFTEPKIIRSEDKRGIGGFKQLAYQLNQQSKELFMQYIQTMQITHKIISVETLNAWVDRKQSKLW